MPWRGCFLEEVASGRKTVCVKMVPSLEPYKCYLHRSGSSSGPIIAIQRVSQSCSTDHCSSR